MLVVDDDDVFREFVRRAVEPLDGALDEARTCQEARERIRGGTYRLVLLDYRLPDGDGIEILEEDPHLGSVTPVVMLTAHGDEELAAQAMRAGASDYLTKEDLTEMRLEQTVRNVLAAQRAGEEAQRLTRVLADTERIALLGALSRSAFEGTSRAVEQLRFLVDDARAALPPDADLEEIDRSFEATLDAIERMVEPVSSLHQLLVDGPDPEPCDVAAVSASVAEGADGMAPPDVHVVHEGEGGIHAAIDKWALRYVLNQLVNNAVEAMPEGGQATIRTEVDGDEVRVVVEDEGPGFPESHGGQAFDLYVTTKEGHEGVGLTVTRHVAEIHGGSVVAEDGPDGARVVVTLPRAKAG